MNTIDTVQLAGLLDSRRGGHPRPDRGVRPLICGASLAVG